MKPCDIFKKVLYDLTTKILWKKSFNWFFKIINQIIKVKCFKKPSIIIKIMIWMKIQRNLKITNRMKNKMMIQTQKFLKISANFVKDKMIISSMKINSICIFGKNALYFTHVNTVNRWLKLRNILYILKRIVKKIIYFKTVPNVIFQ